MDIDLRERHSVAVTARERVGEEDLNETNASDCSQSYHRIGGDD